MTDFNQQRREVRAIDNLAKGLQSAGIRVGARTSRIWWTSVYCRDCRDKKCDVHVSKLPAHQQEKLVRKRLDEQPSEPKPVCYGHPDCEDTPNHSCHADCPPNAPCRRRRRKR